ncbi:MAG: single-stranded-DNA-specific exonuclease RecJ [Alphaproteobacteria bacterium]|nr:MAG: single-stranded-DNA-specific exonuclease RecJ [Alphaproteobacteria bacterium]
MKDVRVTQSLLGVDKSFTGRRWRLAQTDERMVLALTQRHGLPDIVGRVAAARGVDIDNAADYLNPTLRALLPDPSSLIDMTPAVQRLADALRRGQAVAILADYDVDGATSSALFLRYAGALGVAPRLYVPDRMVEGYGPSVQAMQALASEGIKLVVTVDCGTTSYAALDEAKALGLDVIVVDHHAAEAALPHAYAIVNPNRLDETTPHRHLAAVGVMFLLLVATNRHLRESGFFSGDRPEPDLRRWLDLVALGTVCDVMPLTGLNRALVTQGLRVMNQRANLGVAALAEAAGWAMNKPLDAYAAGFVLGPRINAGGRVGESSLGSRLLSTQDAQEAHSLAQRLDMLNAERRAIELTVLEEANQIWGDGEGPCVLVAGQGWHPGVIGIVAARLKERLARPSFVVALDGDAGKGSARSVKGVDIGQMVIAARQAGILDKAGGHAMAAGFSIHRSRLADFQDFLDERIRALDSEELRSPSLRLDAILTPSGATADLVRRLESLAPFGNGHPQPRFAFAECRVFKAAPVGDGHVRCMIGDGAGSWLKAIAFRCADTPLGQALFSPARYPSCHVAGTLKIDSWQGREEVQLTIEDMAAS